MKKITIKTTIEPYASETAAEFIARSTGLSKAKVKDSMNKGAVWIKDRKGKLNRLRKATRVLKEGDYIEFYYSETLLSKKPPAAHCLEDCTHYSIWYKPADLLSQGTKYGDHCSLLRQAEVHFNSQRKVFLVHRLDREASGLVLIAHSSKAASSLSSLFQTQQIIKEYHVEVMGNISDLNSCKIDLPLDNKSALTEFEVMSYDSKSNTSNIKATIKTGRYHQIRRHFDLIGHPVIGDPKYGKGNKNREGMKLSAISLTFQCPFSIQERHFRVSDL
jgi:tRNA pseudouridine32 synthase/23S rRNA pseudouridine746 synthase